MGRAGARLDAEPAVRPENMGDQGADPEKETTPSKRAEKRAAAQPVRTHTRAPVGMRPCAASSATMAAIPIM